MTSTNQKIEDYILRFGKYKNYRAIDVAQIYVVDKDGNDKPVGLMYLSWVCKQDWFKHKDIVEQVIQNAKGCMSDADAEMSPEEKQKKKESKKKKGTVQIEINETLDFQ